MIEISIDIEIDLDDATEVNYQANRIAIRKRGRNLAKNVGLLLFVKAQGGYCPICEKKIHPEHSINVDHVFSIADQIADFGDPDPNPGNLLVVHTKCNQRKGCRPPTETEIVYLAMVNDILQFDEITGLYGVTVQAKQRVYERIESLKYRQSQVNLNVDCRHKAQVNQLSYNVYAREIEALKQMIRDYNEVFNVHDYSASEGNHFNRCSRNAGTTWTEEQLAMAA